MPMSSLPAAILSHMVAINNVPPLPLNNIPSLKMPKNINYGQLNALCHIRGLSSPQHSCSLLAAHNAFIKQYPKIFLHKQRLPKIFKQEEQRKISEETEERQDQPDDSHNIAVHIKKAHGGICFYKEKEDTEKFVELLAILKKLPIHRTTYEHNLVWKMLQKVPYLNTRLTDEHLKTLSRNVISETWVRGSTVVGNDGFYIILKGLARPCTKVCRKLSEENDSALSLIQKSSSVFDVQLKSSTVAELYLPSRDSMLRQWSTFGSLEITPKIELETTPLSVVTEEKCEILKIPAKDYAKLKSEKMKNENTQKLKLIRKCPYYAEWPTLSIYELISLIKWKKFPPDHVIVESGNVISFVAYINSGYCNIYRSIVGLVRGQLNKVKKTRKLVYMGQLKERESFGEISVLLQVPFTCTIVTGTEVELAIIEDTDIFGKYINVLTKQLMLQTTQPTFGHLTDEDVKNKYIQKEQEKEWKHFKDQTMKKSIFYNGIIPGFGKWNHHWSTVPRNLKNTLVN
ncbi:cyclic nucleotide-binding domain-containing protein 1 [Castor canadensis]|uniref:Cyclic nucleotide-binding domain-containing protein 1 n=1 Tax=Castor canadensis TaxID=51338 RepID=A0AC58M0V9_CASCN